MPKMIRIISTLPKNKTNKIKQHLLQHYSLDKIKNTHNKKKKLLGIWILEINNKNVRTGGVYIIMLWLFSWTSLPCLHKIYENIKRYWMFIMKLMKIMMNRWITLRIMMTMTMMMLLLLLLLLSLLLLLLLLLYIMITFD